MVEPDVLGGVDVSNGFENAISDIGTGETVVEASGVRAAETRVDRSPSHPHPR